MRELSGERIDIVPYIDEPDIFISRALSPATVTRVITDERRHHAQVIVDEDQLSLAIGKSGQNSRLAVQLTGWGLDLITDEEYQRRLRRLEESKVELRLLEDVSELISLSLATSGFISIRGIAESEVDMLRTVPGLEAVGAADQLKQRALAFVEQAEARGEALRPATLEELEAEERVREQKRVAQAAAEEAAAEAAQVAEEAESAQGASTEQSDSEQDAEENADGTAEDDTSVGESAAPGEDQVTPVQDVAPPAEDATTGDTENEATA